jgi:drug/metabolite transporter (DMT)-like permease
MEKNQRKPTVSIVIGIIVGVIGVFLAAGASLGTSDLSPIAGTWLQTTLVVLGFVLAILGIGLVAFGIARQRGV